MTQTDEYELRKQIEQLLDRSGDEAKDPLLIEAIAASRANPLSLLLFYWVDSYAGPDSRETMRRQELLKRALTAFYHKDLHTNRDKWLALQSLLVQTSQNSNRLANPKANSS